MLNQLASLAKWLSVCLETRWFCVPFQLLLLKLYILHPLRATLSLIFRPLQSVDSLWNMYVTWQEHKVKIAGTNKCSQHSPVIWPVWLNGWVFIYDVSVFELESSCTKLNFSFHACFEQVVPWHSCNYRVWIHSETRTWHDNNIQSECTVQISTHNTAQAFGQFG